MSTQIAVRLPDSMVEFLDRLVAEGQAPSRASVVDALWLGIFAVRSRPGTRRSWRGRRGDDDMNDLASYAARAALDVASAADHTAQLDQARPVVVLTRETGTATHGAGDGGPITTTVRGLSTEIPVGPANGLDKACVVSCDNIVTVPRSTLGRQIGYLLPAQEAALTETIHAAFDLMSVAQRSSAAELAAQAAVAHGQRRHPAARSRPVSGAAPMSLGASLRADIATAHRRMRRGLICLAARRWCWCRRRSCSGAAACSAPTRSACSGRCPRRGSCRTWSGTSAGAINGAFVAADPAGAAERLVCASAKATRSGTRSARPSGAVRPGWRVPVRTCTPSSRCARCWTAGCPAAILPILNCHFTAWPPASSTPARAGSAVARSCLRCWPRAQYQGCAAAGRR